MIERRVPRGIEIRPATEDDLPACAAVWRAGLDGYQARLGLPPLLPDNPGLTRLHRHTRSTDPQRFLVAERPGRTGRGSQIVGFGSAVERGPVWFLSMLFVLPDEQARGVGRAILDALLPAALDGRALATCTDSAQPVSNGLYAAYGIAPRVPMFQVIGRPRREATLPRLPEGIAVEPVAEPARWAGSDELGAFDVELLGFSHPEDHRFVQDEPRQAFAFREPGGRLAGYGYAGEIGRIGPIAVRDAALLAPVLAHLLTAVIPRGASAIWIPGEAAPALRMAIAAGLRIEGFPTIACWSRPFTDLSRYVPVSPGLL